VAISICRSSAPADRSAADAERRALAVSRAPTCRTGGVCGRYVSVQERANLVEMYNATAVGEDLTPLYNVAPTSEVYGVVEHADPSTNEVDRQVHTRASRWNRAGTHRRGSTP
jgi:hypothetical protein